MSFTEKSYNVFQMFNNQWALATAGSIDDYNPMTIGWGPLGVLWGKPIYTVFVSSSRFRIAGCAPAI